MRDLIYAWETTLSGSKSSTPHRGGVVAKGGCRKGRGYNNTVTSNAEFLRETKRLLWNLGQERGRG